MTTRQVVLVTHRWLGLPSALVLAVVGATGTVSVWATGWLRSAMGPLHESLGLGSIGTWVVLAATAAAVLLECGGIILWWRRKVFTVETRFGWRRAMVDLHHVTGLLGLVLMLILAGTAVMMRLVTPESDPWLRDVIVDLHTTRDYGPALKAVYAIASLGFVAQGLTGVLMWWKPGRRTAGSQHPPTTATSRTAERG